MSHSGEDTDNEGGRGHIEKQEIILSIFLHWNSERIINNRITTGINKQLSQGCRNEVNTSHMIQRSSY